METQVSHNCISSDHVGLFPIFFVIILLMLSSDIPLSSLEERKSEHIRLLQESISQLKQQMAGDCRPSGNMSKHHLGPYMLFEVNRHVESLVHIQRPLCRLAAYFGQLVTGCNGVARWSLFQNKYGNLSSWPALEKLILKVLFWGCSVYSLCWSFFINELNLALWRFCLALLYFTLILFHAQVLKKSRKLTYLYLLRCLYHSNSLVWIFVPFIVCFWK